MAAKRSGPAAKPVSVRTESAAEWMTLQGLTPWKRNPRKNAAAVDDVARSIIAFGWGAPILVRGEDSRIIAGHTRAKASERLQQLWRRARPREREDWHEDAIRTKDTGEVPVRRKFGLTEAQCDALAVADNKTGEKADWDDELLGSVLNDLADEGLVADLGFDDGELDKLLGEDESRSKVTDLFDIDASDMDVHFILTITGPLRDQMDALEAVRERLTERDGVEVFIETM